MIQLKNISKTFRQKNHALKVLDDISINITEGAITGIIGSSGAGKSTLLRSINLLERPDKGEVFIRGKCLSALSNKELAGERRKIGMIFQHFNLLHSRTVFENIALPMELEGQSKTEIREKVQELLQLVALEDKRDIYPKHLSGGQKQRVSIARALANDPYLLLCDEATSALDPSSTQRILKLLADINRQSGITIVLITHEMQVLKSICTDVALIQAGKIVARGALQTLLQAEQETLFKQFIHTDIMNLPPELAKGLQAEYAQGLHPLIEVELNGYVRFEELIRAMDTYSRVPYKVIKADIEYLGKANYGKLLLLLQGSTEDEARTIAYFKTNNIKNTIKGYA